MDTTPLGEAACARHTTDAKHLIARGALIESRNSQGFTALCLAAHYGADEIVKALFAAGADIEATGHAHKHPEWQKTPLLEAAYHGRTTTIFILIELGADIRAMDYFGRTALMHAVRSNHIDSTRLLVQKGADVNSQCDDGSSALHCAARQGSEELCRILTEAGANQRLINRHGSTPWIVAKHSGTDRRVEKILKPKATEREQWANLSAKQPGEIAAILEAMLDKSTS